MFSEQGESLILKNFREFYNELLKVKRAVNEQSNSMIIEPSVLKNTLVSIIHKQEKVAAKIGGYFLEPFSDARYAMIGLADEVLINSTWEHAGTWQSDLLEMTVNGSYIAGEEFFKRADRILSERKSVEYIEAARVYLLCLWLGFKGKFRYEGGDQFIENYTARLYEYVFDKPITYTEDDERLTLPEQLHVYHSPDVQYFPPSYKRYMMLLSLLGLFVIATTIFWFYLTNPIRTALHEFYETPVYNSVQPAVKKPVYITEPQLEMNIVNEKGEKIKGRCTILDSTGFTEITTNEIVQSDKPTVVKLPKNNKLKLLIEANSCYPYMTEIETQNDNVLKQEVHLQTLESLYGKNIILEHISFGSSSSELDVRSFTFLHRISTLLQNTKESVFTEIIGYTDNTGLKKSNETLSRDRAESVLNFLVRDGVNPENLKSKGLGSSNPVGDNSTDAGKLKNRRVEIVFTPRH
ncbi:MAG: DotU family type IV/VI secretion system protein [Candidatus Kapaibacterium sp.]|nr:DotU family type IV/VI secretion system protein [Bacteroidota bacterium]